MLYKLPHIAEFAIQDVAGHTPGRHRIEIRYEHDNRSESVMESECNAIATAMRGALGQHFRLLPEHPDTLHNGWRHIEFMTHPDDDTVPQRLEAAVLAGESALAAHRLTAIDRATVKAGVVLPPDAQRVLSREISAALGLDVSHMPAR